MGPLLTGCRLGRAAALAAALLLSGCEPECNAPTTRTVPLTAPYDRFFNQLPACYSATPAPIAASSSTGLTDSYSGCLSQYTEFSTNSRVPCENLGTQGLRTNNFASLYGFSFTIEIQQDPDGPRLRVRDQSTSSVASLQKLTYVFATNQAELTYYDATSGTTRPFSPAPTVSELTNFRSGSRTYAQVWRVINPLNATQGRAPAATVLFVDRDYGLIRFEQRDGTVWTLNR